ncbi:IS4 transposase [Sinorhizobium meliloti]
MIPRPIAHASSNHRRQRQRRPDGPHDQHRKGANYVFDKGYCPYGWWTAIAEAGASFATRPKTKWKWLWSLNTPVAQPQGDGFLVLEDSQVSLASKGDSKLPIGLRRVIVKRQDGDTITLLTNDLERSAVEIGQLYKDRWQIELLFRWIKQHLKICKFLGNNDNAIRLQIFAAMIAYALLRIAARLARVPLPILLFTDLVTQCLFQRKSIAEVHKPPPVNPSRPKPRTIPNQRVFRYA